MQTRTATFRCIPVRYPGPRTRSWFVRWGLACCLALAPFALAHAYLRPHLRMALQPPASVASRHPAATHLVMASQLRQIYAQRSFRPLWVDEGGFGETFRLGMKTLRGAVRHGLDPASYHLDRLLSLQAASATAGRGQRRAEIELLLSDALLQYGYDLSHGRVDPDRLHPSWTPKDTDADVAAAVLQLASSGNRAGFEHQLAPSHPLYWSTLAAAEELATAMAPGGGPRFATEETLRPGSQHPALSILRQQLAASGDLPSRQVTAASFDVELEQAVMRFQRRHGLRADGVVGPATRAALQVPVRQRHRQLLLTLERLRWLPRHWAGRALVVNVADYSLEAWQGSEPVLEMRVIVGRPGRHTPLLRRRLQRVELNPYWKVPLTIAVQELLPRIRSDASYLEQNGFQLVSSYSDSAAVLDPAAVDWQAVGWSNFPGRIRQTPGPDNALGRVKFLFPNSLDIYLHDTPQRRLFARNRRTLSHGCVRVEQPITLAHYVLQDHPEWPAQRIDAAIASGERHCVELHTPSDVYLLYWTAWADGDGRLQFRPDVYGRDATLAALLPQPGPGTHGSSGQELHTATDRTLTR